MHKCLSDWLRIVDVNLTEDTVTKRQLGIENIVNGLDEESCLDLVRLYLGKPTRYDSYRDDFRGIFQKADQTFRMSGNELELQLLAGISIIVSLENNDNRFKIAMSAVCVSFQGSTDVPIFNEVSNAAKQYLSNLSISIRSRARTTSLKASTADFKTPKDALLTILPQNNLPSTQAPMGALFDKIQEIILEVIKQVNKISSEIDDSLLLQQEETEMLWWVMGECSNSLNKKMSTIPLPFASLIVAKELAEMTRKLPGPISIPALMDKMLSIGRQKQEDKISIKEVINASSDEWKSKYVDRH